MHATVTRSLPRTAALALGFLAALGPLAAGDPPATLAVGDGAPPVVGSPRVTPLAGGAVTGASVPFRVTWTASDGGGSGVASSVLQLRVDGGSWAKVPLASATARSVTLRLRSPHEASFRVRARDRAGNTSAWRYGSPIRVTAVAETAGGVRRTDGWAVVRADGYVGGEAVRSRVPGARLTFAFTGSQVAWFGRRSPTGGSARVFLDGVYRTTVSTYAATTSDRRIQYTARWPASGEHRLTIEVAGTAGHPDVLVDGFVVVDPPAPDPVLVGAGDVATCGSAGHSRTGALLDGIAGRVFVAGDAAYPDGTAAQFRDCYGPTWGRWRLRTSPAVGNHEYGTRGAAAYWDYFGARAGERGKGWYAYDLGTWRIYTLNSNCTQVGCGPTSEQVRWLRADLAAHPRACVAAVMHHPLVSSGEHGPNPSVRPLWEALDDAGADVVIAGHDHDYERFAPQTPSGMPDATGIRQFVVGTGGAALRPFTTIAANSDLRNATTHGILALTLREGRYGWRFVPVAGGTFRDAGEAACH